MPESNAQLARRGFEAVLRGDLEVISGMLDPEVKWHAGDPTAEGACRNREQALAFIRRGQALRGRLELVDVVDAGDKVVVILRRGSAEEDLVANLTTFRGGKVVEMVHYPDPDDALAAARG